MGGGGKERAAFSLHMLKTKKWSIYTRDGQYLGRYSAFAPETALAEYFAVSGRDVSESEIKYDHVDDEVHTLRHNSETFVVASDEGPGNSRKMH